MSEEKILATLALFGVDAKHVPADGIIRIDLRGNHTGMAKWFGILSIEELAWVDANISAGPTKNVRFIRVHEPRRIDYTTARIG